MSLRRLLPFVLLTTLAACGAKPAAKTDPATTTIRFATDWKAEAEHGGFYEAVANGEYARRGLDVKILQGGPSSNVPQLLASGAADMGIGSNSFVALSLARVFEALAAKLSQRRSSRSRGEDHSRRRSASHLRTPCIAA